MSQLMKQFRFDSDEAPGPRFNIAPTQSLLTLCHQAPASQAKTLHPAASCEASAPTAATDRVVKMMHWGLIMSWSRDTLGSAARINCRSETAAEKRSFRAAFKKRRCLILADGYYEWERDGKQRLPWHIHIQDHQPFAMAGLWESWQPDSRSRPLVSCTLLTTEANQRTSFLHDRMPVILSERDQDVWLDPERTTREELDHLFAPAPSDDFRLEPVSTYVNSTRHEGAGCLTPRSVQPHLF